MFGCAMALAGCSGGIEEAVEAPAGTVASLLVHLPTEADVMARAEIFPGTEYHVEKRRSSVTWVYTTNGDPSCLYIARIEDQGDASYVTTSIEDVSARGDKRLCAAVRLVGNESIAAALEGRAADRDMIRAKLKPGG